MKYNDNKKWTQLQNRFSTYREIDSKSWSEEFKEKSKQAWERFAKEDIIMSTHALSRLPRLNKPGLPEISEAMLMNIIKGQPNYMEGQNKETEDIVSVVRRKEAKEAWKNV